MKAIITNPEAASIYLENFNQLGEAIMNSGGNPFMILKRHDEFLRTLAENKIRVTAKYDLDNDCSENQTVKEYQDSITKISSKDYN